MGRASRAGSSEYCREQMSVFFSSVAAKSNRNPAQGERRRATRMQTRWSGTAAVHADDVGHRERRRELLTQVRHPERYPAGSALTSDTHDQHRHRCADALDECDGRPASRAASARARSWARHQTAPADGTRASLHAASRSSTIAAATSARSDANRAGIHVYAEIVVTSCGPAACRDRIEHILFAIAFTRHDYSEGLRPSDSLARSLASRFAGSLRRAARFAAPLASSFGPGLRASCLKTAQPHRPGVRRACVARGTGGA